MNEDEIKQKSPIEELEDKQKVSADFDKMVSAILEQIPNKQVLIESDETKEEQRLAAILLNPKSLRVGAHNNITSGDLSVPSAVPN